MANGVNQFQRTPDRYKKMWSTFKEVLKKVWFSFKEDLIGVRVQAFFNFKEELIDVGRCRLVSKKT